MQYKISQIREYIGKNEDIYLNNGETFQDIESGKRAICDFIGENYKNVIKKSIQDLLIEADLEVEIVPEVKWKNLINWVMDTQEDSILFAKEVKKVLKKYGEILINADTLRKVVAYIPSCICDGFDEFCEPHEDTDIDIKDVTIIDIPVIEKEFFPVIRLSKDDILFYLNDLDIKLSKKEKNIIDNLEEWELEEIADKVGDILLSENYWTTLRGALEENEKLFPILQKLNVR